MVQPVYFGPQERTLFGIRHGAGDGREAALTVAPPLLQEGIATQRALWWLCEQLAAAGVPSLRFDWYGSGDSGGTTQQMTLPGLGRDAAAALAWWNGDGPRAVRQLAVRSGALGVLAAAQQGGEPVDLVLWDPPVSGAALRAAWSAMHRAQVQDVGRYPFGADAPAEDDLLGFDPDPAFLDAVAGFELAGATLPAGSRVRVAGWQADAGIERWLSALSAAGVSAEWWALDTGDAPAWGDPMQFENQLFPRRGAARLAERLAETAAWT